MSTTVTVEQLCRVVPKNIKARITDELVNNINGFMGDQLLRENYRDNILGFASVLNDGRYKIGSYVDAVRYVSYKLMGDTNINAYTKTFPDRFQRLSNEGADDKVISSYSTAYGKTQLVQKIFEQTLTPVHILNADMYQKALNHQVVLMTSAKSEKVQCDAANSILTQLKAPETKKIELDIGIKQDSSIDELRQATLLLAKQQREMIAAGSVSTKAIAHSVVIDGTIVDD